MGKSRSSRRSTGSLVNVFAANSTLGWTVIRVVSMEHAAEQVALGKWRMVNDEGGELLGVQPLRPEQKKVQTARLLVAVTITVKELEMNAGLYGRASEGNTKQLGHLIDEAVEKVRLWPELQGIEPGLRPVVL